MFKGIPIQLISDTHTPHVVTQPLGLVTVFAQKFSESVFIVPTLYTEHVGVLMPENGPSLTDELMFVEPCYLLRHTAQHRDVDAQGNGWILYVYAVHKVGARKRRVDKELRTGYY